MYYECHLISNEELACNRKPFSMFMEQFKQIIHLCLCLCLNLRKLLSAFSMPNKNVYNNVTGID